MEKLISLLTFFAPIPKKLHKRLRLIIQPIRFNPGEEIQVPGDTCKQIFYVEKGLIRIYHMLEEQEVTDWFIKEGDICISVDSFFDQVPSEEYLVALEYCICWGISYEELEATYHSYPDFNVHGRRISNHYYVKHYTRSRALSRQTPAAKYEALITESPEFLSRISPDHMASYLNVGRRSYFKIKTDYLKKKKREKARNKKRVL